MKLHSFSRLTALVFVWTLTASTLVATTIGKAAERISVDQFHELLALCKPRASEAAWTQIPWEIDLWQARQQAAAAGKPIVLWEMDGHPLGCT